MIYEIIDIDGNVIGEYNGILWRPGEPEPAVWKHIAKWSYFEEFRRAIRGTFGWRHLDFTVEGQKVPGLEVFYDAGLSRFGVATIVAKANQKGMTDRCNRCNASGVFKRMSLMCPICNTFLGGL